MTDPERIELLEQAVLLMCKCLDVSRVHKLSDRQLDDLMRCIASISGDLSIKGNAKIDSCETCMFRHQPEYCELNNKKLYGFCGNFNCIDDAELLPRIYKCPKCLYLFNGRDDPNTCPRCGTQIKAVQDD